MMIKIKNPCRDDLPLQRGRLVRGPSFVRGRYEVHAGRDAVGAVLFDHAAEDGRHGQGAETFARMILLVVRPRLVECGHRRPAKPLVRGGGRGHRGRLVADRWRHVRQHDDAVRGHSPPSVGRRCDRRRMAKSLRQTKRNIIVTGRR